MVNGVDIDSDGDAVLVRDTCRTRDGSGIMPVDVQ